ncbi:MAG: ABC transporter ATP-binding protein [Planctomycetota bacterium]|nr:ABC transporter ATP-binding protein [Planctomycetota bacterium]
MANLKRALRQCFRYPGTLAGILISALGVAVLWGGNIGALYPVIRVALRGDSLQSWIAEEIRDLRATEPEIDAATSVQPDGTVNQAEGKVNQVARDRHLQLLLTAQPWVERLFPASAFATVVMITVALVVSTALKGVFLFLNAMWLARLVQRMTYDLRRDLFRHALQSDLVSRGKEGTSQFMSRFHTDIGYLSTGMDRLFGHAIREPLKIVSCLIGAALISWKLLFLSLVLTPITAWLVKLLAGSIKRASRRAMEDVAALFGVVKETLDGIQTVQGNNLEPQVRRRFRQVSRDCLRKSMRIAYYNSLTKPVTEVLGIAVICIALLAGAHLVLNQETHLFGIRMSERPLDQTSLLVFFGFLIGATEPARKLTEVFHAIQGASAAADRLFAWLDAPVAIQSPRPCVALPAGLTALEFHNVSFGYRTDQMVLRSISLQVRPGETLAIVGANGCGKSTLINMLPRFLDPDHGQITWNGVDLRQIKLRELRGRIGFVAQQPLLFDDSVKNNIRAAKMTMSQFELESVARRARVHDFAIELESGYETSVGVSGQRLSGGQRQRIALARALARDPELLILDEATSQIDLESETLIHESLAEFSRNRTVILVTHRLSSLRLADRILVMDRGIVCDLGTHQELMARCSQYQRLNDSQRQAA